MIKINLLPQKRAKRTAMAMSPSAATDSAGTKQFMIGVGALAVTGALVFLLVDRPARNDRADYEAKFKQINEEIQQKQKALEGYETLKTEEATALAKIEGINRLVGAKVVPANVLHELGQILSTSGPTMTERMLSQVSKDPNRKIQADWDPQHVWLTEFIDTAGTFRLEGGAQSKEDVTQLSKRLQASVYFEAVTPLSGDRVIDRENGREYYKFTITGKVAY